jgi:hypothetical protein
MPQLPNPSDAALDILNRLQDLSSQACNELLNVRIQVSDMEDENDGAGICQSGKGGKLFITPLGLINNILAGSGNARVALIVEDNGTVIGFTKHPKSVQASPKSQTPVPDETKNHH